MSNPNYQTNSDNSIAITLKVIAWLTFIGGFILGIIVGDVTAESRSDFNLVSAFIAWVSCFISGILFLGFAEIIILLQKIVDSGGKTLVVPSATVPKPEAEQFSDLPTL